MSADNILKLEGGRDGKCVVTNCMEYCQEDKFWCSQWWQIFNMMTFHWNQEVITMTTLSSLEVVIMATSITAGDDKDGIMTALKFQGSFSV